ncbi:MAG: macro domain-containing protein [Candidatus Eremiobacteraeota bacterium]|nr:macro domain-containing protein [Candidatus Eremiobacteraeota bacterium]
MDEWEKYLQQFESFRPMFGKECLYLSLLGLGKPEALAVAGDCLAASSDPDREVTALLKQGWREHLIAGAALLSGGVNETTLRALWDALDADSWVVPQLAVILPLVDPEASSQMKKRLLLGCPVQLRGQEELAPVSRHVVHGKSELPRYSKKAWSALSWRLFLTEPEWLLERFGADEVWGRLLSHIGFEGAEFANDWHRRLSEFRPDLNMPEALKKEDAPANVVIARRWLIPGKSVTYHCPEETLAALFEPEIQPENLVYPLLREGLERGDRVFEVTEGAVVSRSAKVPLSPGLKSVVLSYLYVHWETGVGVLDLGEFGPEVWLLRMGENVRLWRRQPRRLLEGRLELTRDRLEHANTDAICYGAKDTGEMGGGAAMAVYQSCGPLVLEAARQALTQTSRGVGEVVFTAAYDHECTVYVGHLISIKTKTSEGDWCPEPERLGDGVYNALKKLPDGARTVAFSCLATGEGRAHPDKIARLMIGAVRRFFREEPESAVQVLFCLPDYDDYQAFQRNL